jgi:hypothetical protein
MKTVEIQIFQFNELSEESKNVAREWYRNGNFDYPWHEGTVDDFKANQKEFNVEQVYFSGFYSQGDGAMFEYSDISSQYKEQLIDGLKLPEWKKRVLKKYTYISCSGKHSGHYYHERSCSHSFNIEADNGAQYYPNIERLIDLVAADIEDAIEQNYISIARELYRNLEKEWDELNSDESVDESITANEYEFTENGKRY